MLWRWFKINKTADANLRLIADYLKHFPMCHACVVEGQERYCESINAQWAGREILRTLDRPGWVTQALIPKPKEAKHEKADTG